MRAYAPDHVGSPSLNLLKLSNDLLELACPKLDTLLDAFWQVLWSGDNHLPQSTTCASDYLSAY